MIKVPSPVSPFVSRLAVALLSLGSLASAAAAPLVQVAPTSGSSGGLTWGAGFTGFMNALGVTADDGLLHPALVTGQSPGLALIPTSLGLSAAGDGRVAEVDFYGQTIHFSLPASSKTSVGVKGGTFAISQLKWDLSTGTISGWVDVAGFGQAVDLFQVDPVTLPSQITGASWDLGTVLTPTGVTAFEEGLGIVRGSVDEQALLVAASDVGTFHVGLAAVPEAATWAQMALGLAALGTIARRRSV